MRIRGEDKEDRRNEKEMKKRIDTMREREREWEGKRRDTGMTRGKRRVKDKKKKRR